MKQCGTIEINKSKTQLYIKIIYYNWCIIEVISIINSYESNITSIIICEEKKNTILHKWNRSTKKELKKKSQQNVLFSPNRT